MSDDANLLRRRARRRLVGAIALVVLVVVVLPIILDQKPRPGPQELSVQIPSQDGGPFKTRVLPPLQSAPAAPQKIDPPQAAKGSGEKASLPDAAAKKEAAKAPEKPRAKPKAVQAFVFQLGVFANPDNAKQVRERATAAGIKSYTEHLMGQQGEQIRVRAGPFPSRGAAEKARDRLKSLGMDVGQVAQK
ncbi:MAG TPA: SPOR domain-containing protein [Burkholderiales bacterium]|nr:SPOR domain-containing protein [Burkholderiales bacterium]